MALVAPSILSADFTNLSQDFQWMNEMKVDFIHVDVMDGHYVPNLTFGPPVIKRLRTLTEIPFDVHLMIENPERSIEDYIQAGANCITFHSDATIHVHRLIHEIKSNGLKAGISINPHQGLDDLEYIINDLDQVLIMSVNPGFGGQSFIETSVEKVADLKELIERKNADTLIEVDGGVNDKTGAELVKAGADILVAGSYLFGAKDRDSAVESLRNL